MLAGSETVAPPATSLYFDPAGEDEPLTKQSPRSFKKHKVLPRPRTDRPQPDTASGSPPASHDRSSRHMIRATPKTEPTAPPKRRPDSSEACGLGPDLPPTPPAHSRTSSGSHSTPGSSPTPVEKTTQSATVARPSTPVPGTPTLQKSPPTPDVTPPQVSRRPKAFRPPLTDRIPSKATSESRTESFRTARESPGPSEEEEQTTPRPFVTSNRELHSATHRSIESKLRKTNDVGLGLGLELGDKLTPRTKQEFSTFDGEWTSNSEVEQEWDDNLDRNVMVRKRRGNVNNANRPAEVIEDVTVTPTNATKALRSMSLHEQSNAAPSPQQLPPEFVSRAKSRRTASISESSISTDVRRFSGMSTKSTVSTIVEAILVDVPPQRQKTLRHMKKHTALRDSGSETSPSGSAPTSVRHSEKPRRPKAAVNSAGSRTNSVVSTGTVHSIASRKARRDVWKSGGIPVVVIPDRQESLKPKNLGPPSLRSTNSHNSRRSNSLGAVPRWSHSAAKDLYSSVDKPCRGRSVSVSDGVFPNDQLTMDYPPIVPRRTSSLSAPTSRNTSRAGSRAGSLTAESLKAHNALVEQMKQEPPPPMPVQFTPQVQSPNARSDQKPMGPVPGAEPHKSEKNENSNQRSLVDHNGDPFFGKRLTVHNTPFSQASVETNGTHSIADIAEAMAVNIYPHQNRSVLMIHHMSKPVSAANEIREATPVRPEQSTTVSSKPTSNPEITAIGPNGGPVTPPQPQFSMDDVDSPLRNPRAPPQPPALKFIPATPSGLTPAAEREKMLGNFFEETQKRPSLVRRAFSLRKSSDNDIPRRPSLLARTLSLTRSPRGDASGNAGPEDDKKTSVFQYPSADETPPDDSKLHPFWRPTYGSDLDIDDSYNDGVPEGGYQDEHYWPAGERTAPLRRSLSERVKRTFAILPLDDTDRYITTDRRSPERRTIKRTPSGSLRVMPHRGSLSSVRWSGLYLRDGGEDRPSTAPENFNRRLWGVEKRVDDRGRRLFPNWQDKLEPYKPQNLQRRLSEHRRQKRTEALRQKISGPREVRDGVGEVIKRNSYKGPSYQTAPQLYASGSRLSRVYNSEN